MRLNCGGGHSTLAQGLERGGEEMGWGMATVEYGEVRGPFYRARGREGRWCGEGNDRMWSAPLMAFKPSVLGGERRGRRPVRKGKRRRSSGTRFRAEEAIGGHGGVAACRRSIARWRRREEEDEADAPGAGRLHLGKADAASGVGGVQAGWAGKGRKEAQRGRRVAGRWQVARVGRKKEGGRAKIVTRAEIQGSKRKSIFN
jgi:hypothetical protein